jgi:predicted amidohydrolase
VKVNPGENTVSDHDDATEYESATRPRRPVDRRFDAYVDSMAETLPELDWEVKAGPEPSFPRPDQVNLGLIQFPADNDEHTNIKRALQLAWQAASEGAEIIAFHEMFMLPWVFGDDVYRHQALSHEVDDPIWEPFQTLAAENGVVLVCSFFEHGLNGRTYNSGLVIDIDGRIAGCYRKRHLPPDNERVHFTPGEGPFSGFATRKGRVGVYICWDNFFPEGARALALDHADIVFAPSAATELAAKYKWKIALQHNALVNGIPWVRLNRCEPPFYAHCMVINAAGQIVYEIEESGEQIGITTVDYRETDEVRKAWTFLQDRRPDLYGILGQA